jgi:uncharacterized membrane protein
MKPRNTEAARLEFDYVRRIGDALTGQDKSEIDEVIQSVKEHIEEELSEASGEEVSLVQMANVLERLGPPEDYVWGNSATDEDAVHDPNAEVQSQKGRTARRVIIALLAAPIIIMIILGLMGVAYALFAPTSARSHNAAETLAGAVFVVVILGFLIGLTTWIISLRQDSLKWFRRAGIVYVLVFFVIVVLFFAQLLRSDGPRPGIRSKPPLRSR